MNQLFYLGFKLEEKLPQISESNIPSKIMNFHILIISCFTVG